jgi:hypothetical protein
MISKIHCSINIEQLNLLNSVGDKMRGSFILRSGKEFAQSGNIYANKSSLILDWLLTVGIDKGNFSLRDVSKDREVSLGLIQRVFEILITNGMLSSKGVRTAKKFFLKNPASLLKSWQEHYSLIKKCKMETYHSGLQDKEEMLQAIKNSKLEQKVALALHSAAEAYGYKNTNLQTLELYVLDPEIKLQLEEILQLAPQERGYEVLLIAPYYKSLLSSCTNSSMGIAISPILLTFLDLYHFPLRGQEQAEFMAERMPELKRIFKKH